MFIMMTPMAAIISGLAKNTDYETQMFVCACVHVCICLSPCCERPGSECGGCADCRMVCVLQSVQVVRNMSSSLHLGGTCHVPCGTLPHQGCTLWCSISRRHEVRGSCSQLLFVPQIHVDQFIWLIVGDLFLFVGGGYFGKKLADEDEGYQAF